MKAAFFKLPGEIELRDVPRPEPEANQVLVHVRACGICGWDVVQFREGRSDWHQRGHEYAGVVAEVGEEVTGVTVGDLVTGVGSLPCGVCINCQQGRPKYCLHPQSMKHAAFAEFVCAEPRFFYPIAALNALQGALIEPLTVAVAMVNDGQVKPGSRVLVIGAGPIGLMALSICRHAGASKIYVSQPSTSKARVAAARQLGATRILHPDQEDIVRQMAELEPDGVDSVLVTIKPSIGLPQAAEVCTPGGTIALIGMEGAPEATIQLDIDTWHFKRATLVGSNHNPCSLLYPDASSLLETGVIDADALTSHRFSLADIDAAFDFVTRQKAEAVKVMIISEE